jgi:hypothetical protein
VAPEELARLFHDTYEALAPSHGWETQERSRKDWDEVPAENKSLMIAVAARDGWNEVNNPGGHWWCADHDPNRNEVP